MNIFNTLIKMLSTRKLLDVNVFFNNINGQVVLMLKLSETKMENFL